MARAEKPLCGELAALLQLHGGSRQRSAFVVVEETAVSSLLLTDRFAYRLKRPVCRGMLDFRTVDARRHACELEVRLNRRLAPDVYIDALPITRDTSGALKLGGHGQIVDWVVKMRRLPADRSLDRLIAERAVTESDVANVARVIAEFFAVRPPLCVRPDDYRKCLAQRAEDHYQALSAACDAAWQRDLQRVRTAQRRFLALFPDLLDRRVCDGRIVDGHGDLRPGHIYVESPPVVVDCVEYNDHLRRLDMADELALLAMECDRMGAEWAGRQIVETCCQATHDDLPPLLLDFYKGYRAVVRARATVEQAAGRSAAEHDRADEPAADYLRLACRYLGPLGVPVLLVVGGLMGTGKSTLAASLGELLGIDDLHSDEMRRAHAGDVDDPAAYERGPYESELRGKVYERLFRQSESLLRSGRSVVVDGTFLTHGLRDRARELAARHGAVLLFVACQCSRSLAVSRLAQRGEAGYATPDARPELYDRQARAQQPFDEQLPLVQVDTTLALNCQLEFITKRLRTEFAAAGMLAGPDCS